MDYKNGKIYTLRSYQTDQIYIGSTCSPLSKRLSQHKRDYKQYIQGKYHFITSFNIIKFEDAYIELLEEYPCENKLQLCKREGELIREMNCVNKRIENRTKQEYIEANKEMYRNIKRKYKERNEDKLKKIIFCECGGKYCYRDNARHLKTQKHLKFIQVSIPQENQT